MVNCRVNVDGVRGNLAKSQAPTKGAKVRFDEKSEGEIILPTAPIGNLSRKVNRFEESSFLDTRCRW